MLRAHIHLSNTSINATLLLLLSKGVRWHLGQPTRTNPSPSTDVRLDTDLSAEQADRDEGEDDAAREEEEEQAVISLDLAVGPVDESLVAALEGDEGGGSREEAKKETSGMEEGEEKTERVLSLLGGRKRADEAAGEGAEKAGTRHKGSKKPLIQELT